MALNIIEYKILDKRIGEHFSRPSYASLGSAGLDLFACINQDIVLNPGDVRLINSGIAVYIKDKRYAGIIIPRSGLGHKHGLVLGNGVGLIDSDYQGELKVSCYNRSSEIFTITPGLRIAQLVIMPIVTPIFKEVENFEKTERGEGGFGSTGTHQNTV